MFVPVMLCILDSLVALLPDVPAGAEYAEREFALEEYPEAGMALILLEDSREVFLEANPLDESGEAVVLSLVEVGGGEEVLGLSGLPAVLPLPEGMVVTLPVESPGVFHAGIPDF